MKATKKTRKPTRTHGPCPGLRGTCIKALTLHEKCDRTSMTRHRFLSTTPSPQLVLKNRLCPRTPQRAPPGGGTPYDDGPVIMGE